MKQFIKRFLAGIGIGVGAAFPGVSGSAVAVILKIYEALIWAIDNIFKSFKKAINILIPILLGIIVSLVPCIIFLEIALNKFLFIMMCIFAGFMIGSFPSITDEIKGVKITKKYVICMIIGFFTLILLSGLSVWAGTTISLDKQIQQMDWWVYFFLIFAGFLGASALSVPGLSGSLMLILLGVYKPLLDYCVLWAKEFLGFHVTQSWNNFPKWFGMLGCFAVGVIIGFVVISHFMNKLLQKHRNSTYFTIIGFVAGSIFALFFNTDMFTYYQVWAGVDGITTFNPIMPIYIEIPLGVIALLICVVLSYILLRPTRNKSKNIEEIKPHIDAEN